MNTRIRKKSESEFLQEMVAEYRAAGQPWPSDTKAVAGWAIKNRLWQDRPETAIKRLARKLARAMREERFIDPQGRSVRLKHAYPDLRSHEGVPEQHLIWEDMPRMSDGQMLASSQLRRQQVLGDCAQLKTDIDSFNQNYNDGKPIQMSFDFTEDLIEREQPTKYAGLDDEDDI